LITLYFNSTYAVSWIKYCIINLLQGMWITANAYRFVEALIMRNEIFVNCRTDSREV